MLKIARHLAAVAVLSMAAAPVAAAAANPAASLSIAKSARAASNADHENGLAGGTALFGVIGAVAIIVAILVVAGDDPKPKSA